MNCNACKNDMIQIHTPAFGKIINWCKECGAMDDGNGLRIPKCLKSVCPIMINGKKCCLPVMHKNDCQFTE